MLKFLRDMLAKKEEARSKLGDKANSTDDVKELRSINNQLLTLNSEIEELRTKIKELELEEEEKTAEQKKKDQEDLENQKREENKDIEVREKQTATELRAILKASMGKSITEEERALLVGGSNGEGYILPSDVKTKINKLIRQYKSFRDILGRMPTTSLTGSFPIENFETVSELIDFTDGTDGSEADDIKFKNIPFALKEKGALIKLSNTLLSMTDNDLINYVAEVFAKKAVITENKMAITALKKDKTVKPIADWKALKKSINVDLDEGVKYGVVIVTNQDGFDMLDSALDSTGKPLLQPDPTQPTRKLFKGYPVEVFSTTLLKTEKKKIPIFYGNLSEAVKFVDNGKYTFATSSEAGFKSNTTYARVIEYIDVIQVDSSDKIYIVGEIPVTTEV